MQDSLRYYRVYRHYTQKEIAEYLGISRSAYTLYESGKRQPSIATLTKLADLYQISLDALTGR